MAAAIALSERSRGASAPNPNVGCVIVKDGRVVGRGWTGAGGRPHAEAVSLEQAGKEAQGATLYVTLEPCAHDSVRGPTCSNLIADNGVARVVIALTDPDERTNGQGIERLKAAGIAIETGVLSEVAARAMAPFLTQTMLGRSFVTLKLAVSADGRIARPPGEDRWITGEVARAHGHMERAQHDAILVGRGTYEADGPTLDVRLPGLDDRSPKRLLLSTTVNTNSIRAEPVEAPCFSSDSEEEGKTTLRQAQGERAWEIIRDPEAIAALPLQSLLVEGGAGAAKAFLDAGLVDRLLLYRAPMVIGSGEDVLASLGLDPPRPSWHQSDSRMLGIDRLDVYEAVRE